MVPLVRVCWCWKIASGLGQSDTHSLLLLVVLAAIFSAPIQTCCCFNQRLLSKRRLTATCSYRCKSLGLKSSWQWKAGHNFSHVIQLNDSHCFSHTDSSPINHSGGLYFRGIVQLGLFFLFLSPWQKWDHILFSCFSPLLRSGKERERRLDPCRDANQAIAKCLANSPANGCSRGKKKGASLS